MSQPPRGCQRGRRLHRRRAYNARHPRVAARVARTRDDRPPPDRSPRVPPHAVEERRRARCRDRGVAARAPRRFRVARRDRGDRARRPVLALPGRRPHVRAARRRRRACSCTTTSRSRSPCRTSPTVSPATARAMCRLVGGPARAYNLMVRRDRARGTLVVARRRGRGRRTVPLRRLLCGERRERMPAARPRADRARARRRARDRRRERASRRCTSIRVDGGAVAFVAAIDADG